jgi:SWI/SNF-related matrix-associated actin-dependent regulator of chromatin subfamily A containing DEAD/H box 1
MAKRPALPDPVFAISSDDEDELSPARGDIQPTSFKRKVSQFEYRSKSSADQKIDDVFDQLHGTIPRTYCRNALEECKHSVADAIDFLKSGEYLKIRAPKYNASATADTSARDSLPTPASRTPTPTPTKPKPQRRRLIKGLRPRSSPSSSQATQQPAVEPEVVVIEDDGDSASDAGYNGKYAESIDSSPEPSSLEEQTLRAINESSLEDLAAMTSMSVEKLEPIVAQRPFRTIRQAESVTISNETTSKGGRSRKKAKVEIGINVVQSVNDFNQAINSIDDVVAVCENRARDIKGEMGSWDLDFKGEKRLKHSSPNSDESPLTPTSIDGIPISDPPIPVQPSLMDGHCVMRPFQLYGLNWLSLLYNRGYGCILADEMGVGKTCQVISFFCHLVQGYEEEEEEEEEEETQRPWPNIVMVPPSTLANWLKEFERFAPDLSVIAYNGTQPQRQDIADQVLDSPEDYHVVICTYSQLNSAPDRDFFKKLRPNAAIFDEGHQMKNPKTKNYNTLMRIKTNWRVLLTGTPVQNNLLEMIALLNFIDPTLLDGHMEHIQYMFNQKVSLRDVGGNNAFLYTERVRRARTILEPFILQRRKEQVLSDMPAKTRSTIYCDLLPPQQSVYREFEQDFASGEPVEPKTTVPRKKAEENNTWIQLRKAAIHPLLFRRFYDNKKVEEICKLLMRKVPQTELRQPNMTHLINELKQLSDARLNETWCRHYPFLSKYQLPEESWMNSGKVQKLIELIRQFQENGDRALIFSKFSTVIELLGAALSLAKIDYLAFTGDTAVQDRQPMIDEFTSNPDIPVFLLTTGSGGTGINLTAANKIIIFDQSDNPQDDKQAENRAHRIGQTRPVEVIKLITTGTIEEWIAKACQKKLELAEKVTGAMDEDDEDVAKNLEAEVREMMAAAR